MKALLLDYVFAFVDKVRFHIGAENVRPQLALQRMGATKGAEQKVAYYGDAALYPIIKSTWAAPGRVG